ncbi:30S ribosome-binding factor RbfA [endosymbiont of Pachyrhynchus infernalis]|uniref:30S ribosome-binding factor RbfA n=1 Tax=endosymbiont of Pachyrhynchus infernalis TaxID=1971488 RepID=UPI000DC72C5B|nr:30S ribosome-binding factor RbfA [endosymbiont of Pachyrhynchus infernalis]BBA84955.1 ribosome-binding factor A [endosymbiont of Pachyrhynchus infernalis]
MFYINRLEKDIRYKIYYIILKFINDNRLKNITILDVKLYKDFSIVKIYILHLINNSCNIIKLLNNSSNFIRKKLFKNIKIKKIPKLLFVYDKYVNNTINIINLINNLKY